MPADPRNLPRKQPNQSARGRAIATAVVVAVVTTLVPTTSAPASDTSTRWDRFSESSGCNEPFTLTPVVSRTGFLENPEAILGPFGTYFGRSISEIRSKLVTWTVPHSGGRQVQVHEKILPSLRRVEQNLEANAAEGRVYPISSAHAFTPRTIGGSYRISRHAMGFAIDLNPLQNPFRSDNVLISDMPDWFVAAWEEAGFCWGGDWRGSKDPMHFSWMGPGVTPQADSVSPLPPRTTKSAFRGPVANHTTEFGPVASRYAFDIADANSNGAPDVVGLRPHGDAAVLDIAISSLGYGECSIGRWFVPNVAVDAGTRLVLIDVDGDSGQDMVALSPSGDSLDATIATKKARYEDPSTSATAAGSDAIAITGADFDGDNRADLWEATPDGNLLIWQAPEFTQLLDESPLPQGRPAHVAAGDRDGGDTPELYASYADGNRTRIDVLTYDGSWTRTASISVAAGIDSVSAIGAGDYDGDGRSDAQVFTDGGAFSVFIGNSSTGVPAGRWFQYPDFDCDDPVLLEFSGAFMDDDTSIFEADIESIAGTGVTRGCNPPFNDRYCPDEPVSREQMAAFIVRALGLTDNTHPGFTDVSSNSTFALDIGKLATAGITKGCNPPVNDEYCPVGNVTRGQMAAFLDRAGLGNR